MTISRMFVGLYCAPRTQALCHFSMHFNQRNAAYVIAAVIVIE